MLNPVPLSVWVHFQKDVLVVRSRDHINGGKRQTELVYQCQALVVYLLWQLVNPIPQILVGCTPVNRGSFSVLVGDFSREDVISHNRDAQFHFLGNQFLKEASRI